MSDEVDQTRRSILRFGVMSAGAAISGSWLSGCAPTPESGDGGSAIDAGRGASAPAQPLDAGSIDAASPVEAGPLGPDAATPSAREAGAGDAGPGNTVPEYSYDGPLGPADMFQHGIASGDPISASLVLWTRVTAPGQARIFVFWELARDPMFMQRVQAGGYDASNERDFTVKVDVQNLEAGQTYYYRFKSLGRSSPVGRARTAPSAEVAQLRLAIVSCSSLAHGYFHAYRALAAEPDLDAVVHLGDYIYEYGSGEYGSVRAYEPAHEILTLADYRARHAQYKRDKDLQEVHRQHSFIAVWDDHESANDAYLDGAENNTPATEGSWPMRRDAAIRAYREWMPVRDGSDALKQWRKHSFGGLADLLMLDTRLWARGKQQVPETPPDPRRQLLGADQEAWLAEQLRSSTARWKLIGQQVMMASLGGLNNDQWTGYPAARQRVLSMFRDQPGANVVVLTGDIHSSWANDLMVEPGAGNPVAVEFVAPSVTSPGGLGALSTLNPEVRWADAGDDHGYVLLDVSKERVQAAWFLSAGVASASYRAPPFRTAWSVDSGERTLRQDVSAASAREAWPPLAP